MNKYLQHAMLSFAFFSSSVLAQESSLVSAKPQHTEEQVTALKELARVQKFRNVIAVAGYAGLPSELIYGFPKPLGSLTDEEQKKAGFEARQLISEANPILGSADFQNKVFLDVLVLLSERLTAMEISKLTEYYLSANGKATLTNLPEPLVGEIVRIAHDELKDRIVKARTSKVKGLSK